MNMHCPLNKSNQIGLHSLQGMAGIVKVTESLPLVACFQCISNWHILKIKKPQQKVIFHKLQTYEYNNVKYQ